MPLCYDIALPFYYCIICCFNHTISLFIICIAKLVFSRPACQALFPDVLSSIVEWLLRCPMFSEGLCSSIWWELQLNKLSEAFLGVFILCISSLDFIYLIFQSSAETYFLPWGDWQRAWTRKRLRWRGRDPRPNLCFLRSTPEISGYGEQSFPLGAGRLICTTDGFRFLNREPLN